MSKILIETLSNTLSLNESIQPRKGCLGRIEGICADFKHATRNGRLYGLQLWKNVFSSELFQEGLQSKTIIGELDHPEDRFEPLAQKACIVMTDYEIDEENGYIKAGFDILDTPSGKILKSLLDYGCVLGVSSRGQGDIIESTDSNCEEEVDPDTYDFACFDVVTTPAVKKARPKVVEGLQQTTKYKTFKESIMNQIESTNNIYDLNQIKSVVENTNIANMDSVLEAIEYRSKVITNNNEGKTISSENIPDSSNTNNCNEESTVDESCVNEENTDEQPLNCSAKTIRENKELYECIKNLHHLNSAYKFREKQFVKLVAERNNIISQLQTNLNKRESELNDVTTKLNQTIQNNNMLQTNYKSCMEKLKNSCKEQRSLQSKNKTLEEKFNVSVTDNENLSKQLKQIQRDLNESLSVSHNYKNELKQCKSKLSEKQNCFKKTESELHNTKENVVGLKSELHQTKKRLNESKSKLCTTQENVTYLESELHQTKKRLSASESELHNTKENMMDLESELHQTKQCLSESKNNLTDMENDLQEQLDMVENLKDQLTNVNYKNNQLNTQLKQFKEAYVQIKSKQYGLNNSIIKPIMDNNIMSIKEINNLLEEAQHTKDRYTKLPISSDTNSGTSILSEHLSNKYVDGEMDSLSNFVERVSNVI